MCNTLLIIKITLFRINSVVIPYSKCNLFYFETIDAQKFHMNDSFLLIFFHTISFSLDILYHHFLYNIFIWKWLMVSNKCLLILKSISSNILYLFIDFFQIKTTPTTTQQVINFKWNLSLKKLYKGSLIDTYVFLVFMPFFTASPDIYLPLNHIKRLHYFV